MFECGGCCCPAQPGSVLTPALSRDVRTVAHIAEGVARQVLTFNEDDDDFNMQVGGEGRRRGCFKFFVQFAGAGAGTGAVDGAVAVAVAGAAVSHTLLHADSVVVCLCGTVPR